VNRGRAGRSCSMTAGTWRLLAIIVATIYAAASQNNGPAYLLAFGLVAMGCVGLLYGWRNLAEVEVRVIEVMPAFAPPVAVTGEEPAEEAAADGEEVPERVRVRLAVRQVGERGGCYGVRLSLPGFEVVSGAELPPLATGEACEAVVTLAPLPRGVHRLEEIALSSLYPFGFLQVTQRTSLGGREFPVYPHPVSGGELPLRADFGDRLGTEGVRGDDFVGLRRYQPGESQRHVDWKAVARGHVMQVKQFGGDALKVSLLDWENLPGEVEWKLSRVAGWLLEKEKAGERYGLAFPGGAPSLGQGQAHLADLLERLARYPAQEARRDPAARRRKGWSFLRRGKREGAR